MSSFARRPFAPIAAIAVTLALTGCRASQPKPDGTKTEVSVKTKKATEAPATASLDAKLVAADAADGKTDKVIEKCAGCGLGMMGSPEHAVTVRGYQMHFCSVGCQQRCEKDPDAMVSSLPIN